MKQETNKEMDLLLRGLGRRQDASMSTAGDHLDADELSAYAENVLPAAARARYTEHLAECSPCRELVVQLSSSVNVVSAQETVRVSAPSLLKKFLASLFSPMVLRYAVPALGLIVVAVIGLVILRQERPADVAMQAPRETPSAVTAPATQAPPRADENSRGYADQQKPASTESGSRIQAENNKPPAPPPNNAPSVTVDANVSQEASAQKGEQPSANEPPPQAAPKPASSPTDEKQRVDETSKKQVQGLPTIQSSADRAYRAEEKEDRQTKDLSAEPAARRAKITPSGATGTGSIAKLQRDGVDKEDKDDNAETRSVAGRRFRKQRGIWIDTAYDSSRTTINLARGSEQYRALVADEPAIKTIADELDGEIVVVWKNRAYRIR
jgi:Putative zinc-finger